jgi:hypothetical protein
VLFSSPVSIQILLVPVVAAFFLVCFKSLFLTSSAALARHVGVYFAPSRFRSVSSTLLLTHAFDIVCFVCRGSSPALWRCFLCRRSQPLFLARCCLCARAAKRQEESEREKKSKTRKGTKLKAAEHVV